MHGVFPHCFPSLQGQLWWASPPFPTGPWSVKRSNEMLQPNEGCFVPSAHALLFPAPLCSRWHGPADPGTSWGAELPTDGWAGQCPFPTAKCHVLRWAGEHLRPQRGFFTSRRTVFHGCSTCGGFGCSLSSLQFRAL